MNKAILFLVICGLLISTLSGCGNKDSNTTPESNQAVQVRKN